MSWTHQKCHIFFSSLSRLISPPCVCSTSPPHDVVKYTVNTSFLASFFWTIKKQSLSRLSPEWNQRSLCWTVLIVSSLSVCLSRCFSLCWYHFTWLRIWETHICSWRLFTVKVKQPAASQGRPFIWTVFIFRSFSYIFHNSLTVFY